jgi:Autotransporter beta-domain
MSPSPRTALAAATVLAACCAARPAPAAEAGDVVQATNIGLPLYTYNFDKASGTSIGDKQLLSEFIGAHYFVTSTIRVGMMLQWTEQYGGSLSPGADDFTTFALLPQVGWNFYDHFSAAAIFTYAIRASGKPTYDLGVQGLIGYAVPITDGTSFNAAIEVPYNFHLARTLGVTPLLGLSYRL